MNALKYVSHEGQFYFPLTEVQWRVWDSKKERLYLSIKASGATSVGQHFDISAGLRLMKIEATQAAVDKIAALLASELGTFGGE